MNVTRRFVLAGGLAGGLVKAANARGECDHGKQNNMRTIYGDDTIEITHEPGTGQVAIVSFAGVGMGMGGIQIEEFRKSLAGTTNDIYFVKDKTRHWYNSSFDKISDILNEDISCFGINNVVTLGNSMGGFGALIFAARLRGCRSATVFSPQSCIDPAIVPWERRFAKITDTISKWKGLDATRLLSDEVKYTLFFGRKDPIDIRHAERLASAKCSSMTILTLSETGHDVAAYLKQQGVLQQLIDLLVREQRHCPDFAAILRNVPYRILELSVECR